MSNEKQVTEAPVNFGQNLGYMLDLYDVYLQDPSSVPEDLQVLLVQLKTVKLTSLTKQARMQLVHKATARLNVLCA